MATFWNKIINIHFLDAAGQVQHSIICPETGQKPEIEINGEMTALTAIPVINIKIKSLYLDSIGREYPKIKIEAGYKGHMTTIDAVIYSMYQAEPGPDSTVVISCNLGDIETWQAGTVYGNVDAGGSLEDAVKVIVNSLNLPNPQIADDIKNLKIEAGLSLNCTGLEAVQTLQNIFKDKIVIVNKRDTLCIFKIDNPAIDPEYKIDFLSAPPQFTGGGKSRTYGTVTAPWNPDIRCGDVVNFPSHYFEGEGISAITESTDRTKIIVYQNSFHFSTVRNISKMVLSGALVKG